MPPGTVAPVGRGRHGGNADPGAGDYQPRIRDRPGGSRGEPGPHAREPAAPLGAARPGAGAVRDARPAVRVPRRERVGVSGRHGVSSRPRASGRHSRELAPPPARAARHQAPRPARGRPASAGPEPARLRPVSLRPVSLRPAGPASAAGSVPGPAIFRAEALDARSGGAQRPGVPIRLGEPWLRWLYLVALALVAAGAVLICTVSTAEQSDGTAVVTEPGGRFAALLPIAVVPDLGHARTLNVVLGSRGGVRLTHARLQLADASNARHAGLAAPSQPSVLLTGRLPAGAALPTTDGTRSRLTSVAIVISNEPVGAVVAAEFEVMLGTRQAQA